MLRNKTLGIDAINLRRGGGITHIVELISSFVPVDDGIKCIVIWGSRDTLSAVPDRSYVKKISLPIFEKSLLFRVFWQKFKLSDAVVKENCDVLFVPGGSYAGSFSPVVVMSQNLLPFEWKELIRYRVSFTTVKLIILRLVQASSLRKANGVIFLTEYAKNTVKNVCGGFFGKTAVIPHGVGSKFLFNPSERNLDRLYSKNSPCRILYVSIIDLYKHQWHVVEGVKILRNRGFDVVLDLVGPSNISALNKLNDSIDRFDENREFVNYLGAINYKDLHSIYAGADIGLFASSCENLPIILLETMASGLPVVCSDRGPMPEVLRSAGLYFDPEIPLDIANVLERYIKSKELRIRNSEASFEIVKEYSWDKCAKKTFEFLSGIK